MLEALYGNGWGAFAALLFFQLPFLFGFLWIVASRVRSPRDTPPARISSAKTAWLSAVVVLFLLVNLASIKFIPAVATAWEQAHEKNIANVDITAQSWSYDISQREFAVGQAVRFTAHSIDTVHGFAIYGPRGGVVFTMMLMPGAGKSSLIHKFTEPGVYKIRCLEYCGVSHHEMNDTLTVKEKSS